MSGHFLGDNIHLGIAQFIFGFINTAIEMYDM